LEGAKIEVKYLTNASFIPSNEFTKLPNISFI
jgi:hypothetical protein